MKPSPDISSSTQDASLLSSPPATSNRYATGAGEGGGGGVGVGGRGGSGSGKEDEVEGEEEEKVGEKKEQSSLPSSPSSPILLKEEKALVRKQDLTILPLSAFIYFLCYLDRSNIGNARILNSSTHNSMQEEIGATQYQFNIALMVFLVGYAVFEVGSNVLLKKLRPSRW